MADKRIKRSVEYDITVDDKASKEFKNLHTNAKSSLGSIGGIASTAGTALLGLGAAAGTAVIGIAGFAVKAGDEIEKGLLKFETLLGSTAEAQDRMNELTDFAAKTPFQLDDIVKGDIIMQGFGIRTEKLLTTVGDAAAISGSSFKDLSLIMGQLSQDKSLENIRQLVDRGVISFNELSEAGIEFAKDRSILNSVEETYGAVTEIMDKKFSGGMDKLSNTMSGKVSTLKDTLTLALADLSSTSGLGDFAKDTLDFLNANLPTALEGGAALFETFGDSIKTFTQPFMDELPGIIENLKDFYADNEELIEDLLNSISDTTDSTVELMVGSVSMLKDAWDNDFLFMTTGLKALGNTVQFFGVVTMEIFGGIVDSLASLSVNYEFYWNNIKLSFFEFMNDSTNRAESWANTIIKIINSALPEKYQLPSISFSGDLIPTAYEEAYVSQNAPDVSINDKWEKRQERIDAAALRFDDSLDKLINDRTKKTEEERLAKEQVVINNYYNNQLNDELTLGKLIERTNGNQRNQLQSFGINVN